MNTEFVYTLRIVLSLIFSFFIGLEREKSHKDAGLRTIMLISLGATVFTMIPFILAEIALNSMISFDFSRILAYTISGIGFLAGIVIIRGKKQVEGITTASCIWAVVAMSMLIGLGSYILAIITTLCIWCILKSKCYYNKPGTKNET